MKKYFYFSGKTFYYRRCKKEKSVGFDKRRISGAIEEIQKRKKLLEAERIKRRTNYDLAMIKEIGYCNGIENYSRHLSGKKEGEPPETLLSYFPHTPPPLAPPLIKGEARWKRKSDTRFSYYS